jgi:hypothetical protein
LTSLFLGNLCFYKYEILLDVLLKFMLPIFHGDLVFLSIFGKGVVPYVYLVGLYFFNGVIEIESLATFNCIVIFL